MAESIRPGDICRHALMGLRLEPTATVTVQLTTPAKKATTGHHRAPIHLARRSACILRPSSVARTTRHGAAEPAFSRCGHMGHAAVPPDMAAAHQRLSGRWNRSHPPAPPLAQVCALPRSHLPLLIMSDATSANVQSSIACGCGAGKCRCPAQLLM